MRTRDRHHLIEYGNTHGHFSPRFTFLTISGCLLWCITHALQFSCLWCVCSASHSGATASPLRPRYLHIPQLLTVPPHQHFARELRLSTGECVDAVLVFKLPSSAEQRAQVEQVAQNDSEAQELSRLWLLSGRRQEASEAGQGNHSTSFSELPSSGSDTPLSQSIAGQGVPTHLQHAIRRWYVASHPIVSRSCRFLL